MALKLKPIKIDESKKDVFTKTLQNQEISRGQSLTYDENFPVFRPPYGESGIVYVPNHVIQTEDGLELRMDISNVHNIDHNGRFERIRCVNGLDALGYSHCPIDNVVSKCFELANLKAEHEMHLRNINPDMDSKERREVRRKYYGEMVAQNQAEFYTFPVIELEMQGEGKGRQPVWDAENNTLKYKIVWMVVSHAQFEKWKNAFEEADVENETLGGLFVRLNYGVGVTDEMSERDKRMQGGRNLTVRVIENAQRSFGKALKEKGVELEDLRKKWDQETEEWDIAKSASTVVQNALFPAEDLEAYAEELMDTVEMQLLTYNQSLRGAGAPREEVVTSESIESVSEPLGILPEGSIDED